jgi:hypothetical protein
MAVGKRTKVRIELELELELGSGSIQRYTSASGVVKFLINKTAKDILKVITQ